MDIDEWRGEAAKEAEDSKGGGRLTHIEKKERKKKRAKYCAFSADVPLQNHRTLPAVRNGCNPLHSLEAAAPRSKLDEEKKEERKAKKKGRELKSLDIKGLSYAIRSTLLKQGGRTNASVVQLQSRVWQYTQ